MESDAVHELTAAYALDALDGDDAREYERHLAHCARCRAELATLTEAAAGLAFAVEPVEPPPALRQRILDEARRGGTVVPLSRRWTLPLASVAAAAAAVALGLGLWASSLSRELDETRQALQLVGDPGAESISVTGARGRLLVGRDGRAALVLDRVQPAPEGRTYQAWVIESDRRPAPAGLFDGGDGVRVIELTRRVPERATVAVTLERSGGADAPTGDPLFSAET